MKLQAVICVGVLHFATAFAAGCADSKKPPDKPAAAGKPQVGEASFYGEEFSGQKTASGQAFDPRKLTAASPNLPLGAKAKVTNQENGRSVNVTVTDRGPYSDGRILDLSAKAAEHLDMKDDGVASVKVVPTKPPKQTGQPP